MFLDPEGSNLPNFVTGGIITAKPESKEPIDRIDDMVADVREMLGMFRPVLIVVEITSGKVAGRLQFDKDGQRKKNVQGQGVYGMAVGAVQQACMDWAKVHIGVEVLRVKENVWTQKKSKQQRADGIHLLYPTIDWTPDTGNDMADATGLALWGIGERKL